MPIPPDPTHPKFLEGDDVARPASAQDDDVQGHIRSFAVEEPGAEPDDIMARATGDEGSDDVEGHMKTRNTEDEGSADGEGLMRL